MLYSAEFSGSFFDASDLPVGQVQPRGGLGQPGQLHCGKRVDTHDRIRAFLGDHILDPASPVGGDMGDLATPAVPRFFELIKERPQRVFGLCRGGIDQPESSGLVDDWRIPMRSLTRAQKFAALAAAFFAIAAVVMLATPAAATWPGIPAVVAAVAFAGVVTDRPKPRSSTP